MKNAIKKRLIGKALVGMLVVMGLNGGCTMLNGYNKHSVQSEPESRNAETWGYLNQAKDMLDNNKNLGGDLGIYFRKAKRFPPADITFHYQVGRMIHGKPCIDLDNTWVGGYTRGTQVYIAVSPDTLKPGSWTGVHEAGHALLSSLQVPAEAQHPIMRRCGFPGVPR